MRWITRGIGIAAGVVLIALGPSTRGLGLVLVVIGLVAAFGFEALRRRSIRPTSLSRVYSANEAQTFAAVENAIQQLGYKVLSKDPMAQALSFNTGMSLKTWAGQDYTATLHLASGPDSTELELTGSISQRGMGALQAVSWGETERCARRVLDRVQAILTRSSAG
jgi:hypothetical protein